VPETRADELGTLSRGFNQMTATLKSYTERLEERVAERTRQLEQANAELERTNGALMDSLTCASRLQTALLPEAGVLDRMADHTALWQPRDVVGGDLYIGRVTERGLYVGVIDCTGHGVPGALMTMAAYAAFGHAMARTGAGTPAEVLAEMDRYMRHMLAQDARESLEHGLEIGLLRWAPGDGEMLFAGGGIELLAVDPERVDPQDPAAAVVRFKADRTSLGYKGRRKGSGFTDQRVPVVPNRAVYLTTDGVFDQVGGPRRHAFGRKRFYRLLATHAGQPMAEQGAALRAALADWQGDEPQRDDITAVGLRPLAADGGGHRQDGRTGG
jgi:serine phosphatase RsbU (regulator of sigma subunit)